eukprot:TRINITY_DN13186_c0_g1_i1.p1 TRINITY_DN13186_c0_g1~~TRINITY_DN13186_c0_g1_i1.p1  ORF type:complete len:834 (-),score=151.35 TRINITY_DN13186_c0_g1_i1:129-2630(-)
MLEFSKLFSLTDIYSKISKDKLRSDTENLDIESCRLAIVGQERDDIILVTYDGFLENKKRSFIDYFNTNTKELTNIYKHENIMDCIGCSVSKSKGLLAFTTLTKVKNRDEEQKETYQTYVVEVNSSLRYEINIRQKSLQHIQFLYGLEGPAVKFFLFFLDKEYIYLFRIATRTRRNGGETIVDQPTLQSVIIKKHIWAVWDTRRGFVHVLLNNKGLSLIRCYAFLQKEEKLVYEAPVHLRLSSQPVYQSLGIYRPSITDFHVVRVGDTECLCQQHVTKPNQPEIKVTIHFLQEIVGTSQSLPQKMTISIPMNNYDMSVVSKTRVYFDSFLDMLLVFIPGHYFQLVDCGSDHDPYPSLSGIEFASTLPELETGQSKESLIIPFDVFEQPFHKTSSRQHGLLLDCQTGVAYEYSLIREEILKLFSKSPSEKQVQALHLVISHMHDDELLELIFSKLRGFGSVTALFREYLIAKPYQDLKAQLKKDKVGATKTMTDLQLLPHFPSTSLESFQDQRRVKNIKFGLRQDPSYFRRKFCYEKMVIVPSLVAPDPAPAAPQPSFRKILRIFGIENSEPESVKEEYEEEFGQTTRKQVVDAMATHLMNMFPREEKNRLLSFVSKLRSAQAIRVGSLYKYICRSEDDSEELRYEFEMLQQLYAVLEELSFPAPRGFGAHFLHVGFEHLPRRIFLQYLDQGLFRVDIGFLEKAMAMIGEDVDFKELIISKIKDSPRNIYSIMRQNPDCFEFLLRHYLSGPLLVIGPPREPTTQLMEATSHSPFMPLACYMEMLKTQYDINLQVDQNFQTMYRFVIQETNELTVGALASCAHNEAMINGSHVSS